MEPRLQSRRWRSSAAVPKRPSTSPALEQQFSRVGRLAEQGLRAKCGAAARLGSGDLEPPSRRGEDSDVSARGAGGQPKAPESRGARDPPPPRDVGRYRLGWTGWRASDRPYGLARRISSRDWPGKRFDFMILVVKESRSARIRLQIGDS